MDDKKVKEILDQALATLVEKDAWLFEKNLSEQGLSHKLAEYLQPYFADDGYHVDCEYNGDVDDRAGKKRIDILKSRLAEFGLLKPRETMLEKELIERAVFPDIIIHKRGGNEHNLLVIELKKASSKVPFEYDNLKLSAYTNSDYDSHLNYQLGAFIVTNNKGIEELSYYKNGSKL